MRYNTINYLTPLKIAQAIGGVAPPETLIGLKVQRLNNRNHSVLRLLCTNGIHKVCQRIQRSNNKAVL